MNACYSGGNKEWINIWKINEKLSDIHLKNKIMKLFLLPKLLSDADRPCIEW